ncbi:hypothetical protein A0H81_14314 [Grifola frondosa]|uniref:Pre-rRNA-processing protein RIX1 n=1 Tax=Grifola frondosa TaxID=5627 RepID=A0A1C7LM29_GRIFR|nr:hypothetical protein A0H81_14314 [Grifola frondosa]
MLECAQSWLGAALPLLSNQPLPTVKAAIRLLRHIFSGATDVSEFQRQLAQATRAGYPCQPMPLYPTLHRALYGALSNLALKYLNGSAPSPTPQALVDTSSGLYAVLHLTGGKVGATNLWRKSLDDTLGFAWGAFSQMRTTYPDHGSKSSFRDHSKEDPIIAVPLALDRLRAAVHVLGHLLRATTSRPVSLPIDEQIEGHVDQAVRSLEESVIPALWMEGCKLLGSLAESGRYHLTPHLHQLISYLSYHLEQPRSPTFRLAFLRTATLLLVHCYQLHDTVLSSRLTKAILPSLTVVLATQSQVQGDVEQTAGRSRSRKAKKRARGYEGDEVFKVSREIICPSTEDGEVLLAALDAVEIILMKTYLAPPVYSIASRILLSIYISWPNLPPAVLSPDLVMHGKMHLKLQEICSQLASGTTSTLSKSLGLVINTLPGNATGVRNLMVQREIDLFLHPRVPPLVRSLPHVEKLSLFRAEESQEEVDARHTLGLGTTDEISHPGPLEAASGGIPTTQETPSEPFGMPSRAHEPALPVWQHQLQPVQPSFQSPVTNTSAFLPTSNVPKPQLPVPQQSQNIAPVPSPPSSLPNTLPSSMSASMSADSHVAAAPRSPPAPGEVPMNEDDDEPMPTINMDSDSD